MYHNQTTFVASWRFTVLLSFSSLWKNCESSWGHESGLVVIHKSYLIALSSHWLDCIANWFVLRSHTLFLKLLLWFWIDKAWLFMKFITLEVRAIHFIHSISTLLVIVWLKQPKPCGCTYLQVMDKIYRKITKMPAKYEYFDNVKNANK